jgi:hypothetical protein
MLMHGTSLAPIFQSAPTLRPAPNAQVVTEATELAGGIAAISNFGFGGGLRRLACNIMLPLLHATPACCWCMHDQCRSLWLDLQVCPSAQLDFSELQAPMYTC